MYSTILMLGEVIQLLLKAFVISMIFCAVIGFIIKLCVFAVDVHEIASTEHVMV